MSDRKDPEKLAAENRDDNPENNGKTSLSPPDASEYVSSLSSRNPVRQRILLLKDLRPGNAGLLLAPLMVMTIGLVFSFLIRE